MALDAVPLHAPGRSRRYRPQLRASGGAPSWERYLPGKETTLSLETLKLIDGLVSYLAAVVQERAPLARWEFARHRVKGYLLNKHPVLVSGSGETHNFLPSLPLIDARGVLHGAREPRDDAMADHARRIIEQLNGPDENTDWLHEPEPPFEIEEVREGPDGYDFEIGLATRSPTSIRSRSIGWSAGCPARPAYSRPSGRTGS